MATTPSPDGTCSVLPVLPLGDDAVELLVTGVTNEARSIAVLSRYQALLRVAPPWLVHVQPTAASLRVAFSGDIEPDAVAELLRALPADEFAPGPCHDVAVVYDGMDLAEVALRTGLGVDDVIARHAGPIYLVAFTGFSPGFPYLLGLDEALHLPRRATPRPAVDAGSVAVAGPQTGIYPVASPGGWHLLGHVIDVDALTPTWMAPGHRVRFCPVRR